MLGYWMMSCIVQKHERPLGWTRHREISFSSGYGDGSKPWYLVNPIIAGLWLFILPNMLIRGFDPFPYVSTIRRRGNTFTVLVSLLHLFQPFSPFSPPSLPLLSPFSLPSLSLLSLPPLSLLARLILASTAIIRRWCVGGLRAVIDLPVCQPTDMPSAQHQIIHSCPQFGLKIIRSYSFFGFKQF